MFKKYKLGTCARHFKIIKSMKVLCTRNMLNVVRWYPKNVQFLTNFMQVIVKRCLPSSIIYYISYHQGGNSIPHFMKPLND
jgi:hypothetical protein